MPITYQVGPIIETVRAFIDSSLTASGTPAIVLPLLTAVMQYPFDPDICPLLVLEPIATNADWRSFAVGDVTLSIDLNLHDIRLRAGLSGGEESAAVLTLCAIAAAFSADFRLDGAVQNVLVESITVAEPDTLHRLGIPTDENTIFAAATMRLKVVWIESCFAAV